MTESNTAQNPEAGHSSTVEFSKRTEKTIIKVADMHKW